MIWYNRAMKGFVSMKNYILMIVLAVLTFEVWAVVGRQTRSYGYKPGSGARRLGEGGASEVKAKGAAEKQVHAKAKEISAEKLELPKDATCNGLPIDLEGRIASLCGFEIGKIAKLPTHPKLDKDGNIIMTGKLAKPFRKCTQYELAYSKNNHALYSIRVLSPAQKKMDDEAVWAEVKEMAAAVKAKFGEKILSWGETNAKVFPYKMCKANLKLNTFQSFEVRADKANIDKSNKLKGTADARPEQGWAFSITLVDRGIHDFVPKQPQPEAKAPEGVDAL